MSIGTLYVIVHCLLVLNDIAGVRQVSALPTPTAFRSKISKESRPANTNQPTTNGFTAIDKKMFVCPRFAVPFECPVESEHECVTDQDCDGLDSGDELFKCCRDGCELRCLPGVIQVSALPTPTAIRSKISKESRPAKTVQPTTNVSTAIDKKMFVCPSFQMAAECPPEPDHECQTDQDCDALHHDGDEIYKCCADGCERRCYPGILTHPTPALKKVFVCPRISGVVCCEAEPDHDCATDEDCDALYRNGDEIFKCCADGCNFKCLPGIVTTVIEPKYSPAIDKKLATCPIFPVVKECPSYPDDECQTDQDCDALDSYDEVFKCCRDGCDMRCIPAIPPTPTPAVEISKESRLPNTKQPTTKDSTTTDKK